MSTIETADFLEAERSILKSDRESLIDPHDKISGRMILPPDHHIADALFQFPDFVKKYTAFRWTNFQPSLAVFQGAGECTNLYAGLSLALKNLNDDRAANIILVTDAVTNTGVVNPEVDS